MARFTVLSALFTGGLLCLSCSGDDGAKAQSGGSGPSSLGGMTTQGGSLAQGGASQGGVTLTGGTATRASGGSIVHAGSGSLGGTTSQGGTTTSAGGTPTGGSTSTGGSVAVGGSTSKGGSSSLGGTTSKGGSTSRGGSTSKGGSTSSGGTTHIGGTSDTGGSTSNVDPKRYRIMWSSDFPPIPVTNSDPDDVQTVIRLILYSNELELEGFIASAGTYGMVANKGNFEPIWAAYEKVYPNLQKHDPKYPTPAAMRAITFEGKGNNNGVSIKWECNKQPATNLIGAGKESEASKAIIAAVDKPDPRPLWIGVAGGPREVAQAIWTVRSTRSEADAKTFISKLRVFLIACQDSTDQYIMSVPGLFVIDSKTSYTSFCCGSNSACNLDWTNANIRTGHGPLGSLYPERGVCSSGVAEGDTPAFMHLVSALRNINNPENPSEPGWGGQYKLSSDNKWLDGGAGKIVSGRATYQAEFAARADWMVQ